MVFQTLNKGLCVFSCIETFDISRYFAKVRNGGGGRRVLQACLQLQPCKPDLLAGRVHNRPDWCLPPARRTLRNAHCETHTAKPTLQNALCQMPPANAHYEMHTEKCKLKTSHCEMPPALLWNTVQHCEMPPSKCALWNPKCAVPPANAHYEMHTEKCAFSVTANLTLQNSDSQMCTTQCDWKMHTANGALFVTAIAIAV